MRTLLILAIILCFCSDAHSQDSTRTQPNYIHSGKIGLGLDGITASPNLLMKYFFNNQLAVQILVGLNFDIPGGSVPSGQTKVNGMAVRGGLSLLFHIARDQVSPYIGVEGVFQTEKAAGFYATVPDPKNTIVGGGVFGAEFFLNERFTLGIKQALGAEVQLKRDVPKEETDIVVYTSTVFTGRFYFN